MVSTATVTTSASTTAPVNSDVVFNNYTPESYNNVNTTAFPFCPGQDGQNITTPFGNYVYNLQCYVNLLGTNIVSIIAYTLEDCIQACSNMNAQTSGQCVGVNYWAEMSAEFATNGGNCWLKQTLGADNPDLRPLHLAAILQVNT